MEEVEPRSIVAFTFTEKAALSMKSRIYTRVEEISGPSITARLGEMYVGTIHAYAKRLLDDYFGYGNYNVMDENQEIAFLMRQGWRLGLQHYGGSYIENCRAFLRTVNMVWGEMLDEGELREKAPDFHRKIKKYESILEDNKQLTFPRMISQAVINLRGNPETLTHIRHLIVDEYQDINKAQQEFIELVGRSGDIFIVGDPRQSIYQWRGSDQQFFEIFAENFPGTKTLTIRENRRSTKKIVCNANRFANSFGKVLFEPMDPTRTEDGFIGIVSLETPEDEAKWIAEQVEELVVKKGQITFSDVGILTRSVSTSAMPLIDEFKRRDIPYIVGGKVGLFKRDEAQALGRIFAWFSDGGFWVEDSWKWGGQVKGDILLTTGLLHVKRAQRHGYPADAEKKLREIKKNLNSQRPLYDNLTQVYHDVLLALGFEGLDYSDVNDAPIMANLGRFNVLLTDYETANRIGGRTIRWKRELKGLCWFMNAYALRAYEEQPSDDIRGLDAVQIMTIHQAKGLEWPVVFLFANINRRFPASLVGRELFWFDIPRDMFDAQRYEGSIEDEKRLFYVAITRARDALLMSYFRRLTRNVSKSIFFKDVDRSLTSDLDGESLPALTIQPSLPSEEVQTFSSGEIITYNICPHMYLLQNVWGYQPGLVQAIGFGRALHYCLRRVGELIKNRGYDLLTAIEISIEKGFHIPFVGGVVFEYFKNSAKKILVNFSKRYEQDFKRIEEVEYRLEFPIYNATIMGKVDVIMRDHGQLEVRDYKTSEEVRTYEEVCTQVRLYTIGLRGLGRPVASGSIAYLEEPDVKMVDIDDTLLGVSKGFAERTVECIMKRQFGPTPGENCKRCDQRAVCKWSSY